MGDSWKKWVFSKTLWTNAFALAAIIFTALLDSELVKQHPDVVLWFAAILAVVNGVLRFLTKTGITLLLLIGLAPLSAVGQVQLCAAAKLEQLRSALPETVDPKWQDLFHDPATLYYTEAEMPPAYQFSIAHGRPQAFHSTLNNVSADARERATGHGNANREFPWRMPGGTDTAEGSIQKFTLFRLPPRQGGGVWPIVHWSEVRRGDVLGPHTVLAWVYPVDTVFGEVLRLRDPAGRFHTFEVRLRFRGRDAWGVEILRPYPSAGDLVHALREEGSAAALQAAEQIEQLTEVRVEDVRDTRHPDKSGFVGRAAIETLPELPADLAARLLAVPFRNSAGHVWREAATANLDVLAPTSAQAFSIVPAGYRGAFLGNDSTGCMRCHQHTLRHAREFDAARDWYGFTRGSADGILSCHIVEPSCISPNGMDRPVMLRKAFVEGGMLEQYDPRHHPPERYTFLEME